MAFRHVEVSEGLWLENRLDSGDCPVDCGFHYKVAEASLLLELLAHELDAVERCACRILVGFAGFAGFVEDSLCKLHVSIGHEGKDTGEDQADDGGERLNCCGPRGDGLGTHGRAPLCPLYLLDG